MRVGKEKWLWVLPAIALLLIIGIFPLGYSILLVFTNGPPGWKYVGLGNIQWLVSSTNLEFWTSLQVSMMFVVICLPLEFLLGLGLALLVSEEIRGRSIVTTIFILPMMISSIVVGLLWRMMFQQSWGIINVLLSWLHIIPAQIGYWPAWNGVPTLAYIAIIVADVWQWSPFVFLMLRAGMDAVPRDPVEAAKVDGASSMQIFRRISLPMLTPIILITLLMRLMDLIKMFDLPFILTNGGPGYSTETLSVMGYFNAFRQLQLPYAATISWVIMLIIIILVNVFMYVFRRARR